jgi:ribosomal protein S18 acetylase RimI-like enzyme
VKIRPLIAEDKPVIMEMLGHTPEFTPEEVAVAGELIDDYLDQGIASGYHHLVAVTDLRAAGYICYGPTPLTEGTWDVYWMAVSPERKGQGMGRMLLESAEEKIRAENGRLIVIETSSQESYVPTRGFYLARGYGEIASIPDYYKPGDGLVVFQKRLG